MYVKWFLFVNFYLKIRAYALTILEIHTSSEDEEIKFSSDDNHHRNVRASERRDDVIRINILSIILF